MELITLRQRAALKLLRRFVNAKSLEFLRVHGETRRSGKWTGREDQCHVDRISEKETKHIKVRTHHPGVPVSGVHRESEAMAEGKRQQHQGSAVARSSHANSRRLERYGDAARRQR